MSRAKQGPRPTGTGERVLRWLSKNEKTQQWLADELGVERVSLWRWIVGERKPLVDHCVALERITGIEVSAWTTPSSPRRAVA